MDDGIDISVCLYMEETEWQRNVASTRTMAKLGLRAAKRAREDGRVEDAEKHEKYALEEQVRYDKLIANRPTKEADDAEIAANWAAYDEAQNRNKPL
jgi:hypothetical protein